MAFNAVNGKVTFEFQTLPKNVEELKQLKEAQLTTPFEAAALTVLALVQYPHDKDAAIEMLNFLRGPRPLSNYELQFLRDRFSSYDYVARSYIEGAKPENDYTPNVPYRISVTENPYSYGEDGYAKLFIASGGADSPRPIKLRAKGGQTWFLWEELLMTGIRKPVSEDPWA